MNRALATLFGSAALALCAATGQAQDTNYIIRGGFASGLPGSTAVAPITLDNLGGSLFGLSFSFCNNPTQLDPVSVDQGAALLALAPDFFDSTIGPDRFTVGVITSTILTTTIPVGVGQEIVRTTYTVTGSVGSSLCACASEPSPVASTFEFGEVEPVVECGWVAAGTIDATGAAVIYRGETPGGAVNSVDALRQALQENSVTVYVVDELSSALFTNPQSLWVMNGTYPENHVLSAAEGQFLVDRILDGVPVYLESGDAWGFDAPTPFSGYDGVDLALVGDGDDSFQGMIGSTYLSANFGGLAASYRQDNPAGNDYTDRLVASTTDSAGPMAGAVWSDDGTGGAAAPYSTGVFYRTAGFPGDVLVQSWEFGGYEANRNVLAQRYLFALGLGNNAFGRGDVNADSSINIADAQGLLNLFFVPGSPGLICRDAGDANDDGALDLSDAVYLLTWLFAGGAPLPPPGCGIDPTPDGLDCLSSTPCLI